MLAAMRTGAAILLVALAACTGEPSHPPVARIKLDPLYIPEHDAFVSLVTLSGKTSADPFDDPAGEKKLTYHWDLPASTRVASGSLDGPDLTIRLPGDRPAEITLTVTDATGDQGSSSVEVGLIK
jgi:hypothetical protein